MLEKHISLFVLPAKPVEKHLKFRSGSLPGLEGLRWIASHLCQDLFRQLQQIDPTLIRRKGAGLQGGSP